MKASYKFTKCSGFTLIEIIITLVIVSILSTMVVTYMGTSFQQSSRPIHNYQKTLELHQTMENILAHYKSLMEENTAWKHNTNYAEGDVVTPTTGNGHRYICTKAGASNADPLNQPAWPVNWPDVETLINDNTVVWMESLAWLKINKIGIEDPVNKQDNAYGAYFSIENRFIKFKPDGTEDPAGIANGDPADILKVTIANDIGQILTNLYTTVSD